MNGWLLDTNVVSELRKAHPDRRVKAWSDAQAPSALFLSTVTLAEIRYGIELQSDHRFQVELATRIDQRARDYVPCLLAFPRRELDPLHGRRAY